MGSQSQDPLVPLRNYARNVFAGANYCCHVGTLAPLGHSAFLRPSWLLEGPATAILAAAGPGAPLDSTSEMPIPSAAFAHVDGGDPSTAPLTAAVRSPPPLIATALRFLPSLSPPSFLAACAATAPNLPPSLSRQPPTSFLHKQSSTTAERTPAGDRWLPPPQRRLVARRPLRRLALFMLAAARGNSGGMEVETTPTTTAVSSSGAAAQQLPPPGPPAKKKRALPGMPGE
ncbi:hypothetical protein HU200_025523 [Digitaria exilis]|uniref:Uncharacterized protein n=1 Tax=Digitaria exilis TaxID=1010633 RepID=A0A835C0P4_9POAL|nr:hypothetical protein HU200_025523 [Digitaria exilis]